jgi:DHA1 family multidrug resistance protein-like MFS transporter
MERGAATAAIRPALQPGNESAERAEFPFWRANMVVLTLANVVLTAGFSSASPYLPLILREMGFGGNLETWVGIMVGGFFFVSFFLTPVWGMVADHFGRKSMVLRAGMGMGVWYLLLPWLPSPWLFISMYVLMGAFNGFVPSALALAATNTPVRRMGRALSMIQTGALLGNTFGPAVGGILAVILPRYRLLFLISGLCILSAGFLALFFARERSRPAKGPFEIRPLRDLALVSRIPGVVFLYGLNFLVSVSFWGSIPVVSVYTLELLHAGPAPEAGAEEFWMGAVAMALAVASALALPAWGRVLDRLEPSRVLALCLFSGAVGSVFTVAAMTPLHLVLARLAFGLLAAGAMPTLVTMMRRLAPAGMEARALALGTAFGMLGMGCGPLLGGLIGPFLGLRAYFALNSALLLIGFLAWARFGPQPASVPRAA